MASFNFSTRQMSAKIVYYGPGLCGKTTSLKYVFHHTRPEARGKMVSLATETDRTLFFDLLPLEVGKVAGFHTRIQLYTVPGQVFYNSTRRLVLKGVDGIVFVADSQPAMLPSNVESFRNLEVNLEELGIKIDEIPLVLQYNKRDLPEVCAVEELREALNTNGWPEFETSALAGTGIFEVLREVSKLTLIALKKQLEDGVPDGPRVAAPPEVIAEPTLEPMPETAEERGEPIPEPTPAEPVAEMAAADEPSPAAAEAGLTDDDIEDSALAQLGTDEVQELPVPALVAEAPDEVAAAAPAPEPAAAEPETPDRAAAESKTVAVDDLDDGPSKATEDASPEPEPKPEDAAAVASTNGRRSIDRLLNLALQASDLERATTLSLDLQVRDGRNRVLHQVRDFEWSLQDLDRLQDVLLNLKIELEREES